MKNMIKANKQINGARVVVFGITFKENCPDVRNTKVVDVIRELEEYGVEVMVVDPVADKEDVWHEYRICLRNMDEVQGVDAVIIAVPHEEFTSMRLEDVRKLYVRSGHASSDHMAEVAATVDADERYVLIDVKGMFDRKEAENMGFSYWRL